MSLPDLRRCALLAGLSFTALAFSACSSSSQSAPESTPESVNAGGNPASDELPFERQTISSFDVPWALAFLPDARMLVTEKPGRMFIVTPQGDKRVVGKVPDVAYGGQNGLLDVAVSPRFGDDAYVYLSYNEPGDGGSSLALARARLVDDGNRARLEDLQVIWRQMPKGGGGQPGGIIAFAPDGKHLFLSSGDRMRPDTAQDAEQALGKLLRLNLDGSTPDDNPQAGAGGARAQIWTSGHRNPYGLAFAPDGKLWLHEMGPKGGDELNLIVAGNNYGWPVVSNGDNYDGSVIPDHPTRPEFAAPPLYWTPVISPAGLTFYSGQLFPDWRGSAFIGGLSSRALLRISFEGGNAREANRWNMGARIRDVGAGPDGALWVLEDGSGGRLLRLIPKST